MQRGAAAHVPKARGGQRVHLETAVDDIPIRSETCRRLKEGDVRLVVKKWAARQARAMPRLDGHVATERGAEWLLGEGEQKQQLSAGEDRSVHAEDDRRRADVEAQAAIADAGTVGALRGATSGRRGDRVAVQRVPAAAEVDGGCHAAIYYCSGISAASQLWARAVVNRGEDVVAVTARVGAATNCARPWVVQRSEEHGQRSVSIRNRRRVREPSKAAGYHKHAPRPSHPDRREQRGQCHRVGIPCVEGEQRWAGRRKL